MKVKVKLNHKNINLTKAQMIQALVETADATKSDLVESQTMPFGDDFERGGKTHKGGTLQNKSTFVDDSKKNYVECWFVLFNYRCYRTGEILVI